jgi:hypothetical protein
MLIEKINSTQIVLEVYASNPDGSIKTNITTANVRVYHVAGGSEVVDLISTSMVQVGSTNVWRYVWAPATLSENKYIAEYSLVDSDGLTAKSGEDLVVGYLESKVDIIATDVNIIKEVQLGRWQITADNKLTLYKEDGVTVITQFNLYDIDGKPSIDAVTDRVKI